MMGEELNALWKAYLKGLWTGLMIAGTIFFIVEGVLI